MTSSSIAINSTSFMLQELSLDGKKSLKTESLVLQDLMFGYYSQ